MARCVVVLCLLALVAAIAAQQVRNEITRGTGMSRGDPSRWAAAGTSLFAGRGRNGHHRGHRGHRRRGDDRRGGPMRNMMTSGIHGHGDSQTGHDSLLSQHEELMNRLRGYHHGNGHSSGHPRPGRRGSQTGVSLLSNMQNMHERFNRLQQESGALAIRNEGRKGRRGHGHNHGHGHGHGEGHNPFRNGIQAIRVESHGGHHRGGRGHHRRGGRRYGGFGPAA